MQSQSNPNADLRKSRGDTSCAFKVKGNEANETKYLSLIARCGKLETEWEH